MKDLKPLVRAEKIVIANKNNGIEIAKNVMLTKQYNMREARSKRALISLGKHPASLYDYTLYAQTRFVVCCFCCTLRFLPNGPQ